VAEGPDQGRPPRTAWESPEELRDLLKQAGQRPHYVNRVAIGESVYAWELAELLSDPGDLALRLNERNLTAAFGDGWTKGTIPREERRARLLEMLAKR